MKDVVILLYNLIMNLDTKERKINYKLKKQSVCVLSKCEMMGPAYWGLGITFFFFNLLI